MNLIFPTVCDADIPYPLDDPCSSLTVTEEPAEPAILIQPEQIKLNESPMETFEVEPYMKNLTALLRTQKNSRIHVKEALSCSEPVNVSRYFYAMLELTNKGIIVIDKPQDSESTDDWFITGY